MPSVSLRGILRRFDGRVALDRIDLDVRDGEYLALVGPTGAGKTTLLRIIAGLLRPNAGHVLIDGRNITRLPPEERGISYMSQTYSLFPHLTVWDNAGFSPVVRGVPVSDTERLAREMLLLVGLLDRSDAHPRELSGGMQQRTALARSLAAGTNILLLDEPLRALDARLRIALRLSIRRLCKDLGITAIHVTHDQEEALLVADRLAILRRGKVEQLGPPRQVYDKPANPFVAHFLGEANFFVGRVEEVTSDRTVIRSNGRTWHASPSALRPGQEGCLAVRAENMRVTKSPIEEPNGFEATVLRRLFLGRFVGLQLESDATEMPLKARLWEEEAKGIDEGERVRVAFDPELTMVFPLPRGGLAKELEVE